MSFLNERGVERRRQPRGGRRTSDRPGYAPLVFVVHGTPQNRDICEAILVRLRFAVAPFDTAEQALKVVEGLRPEVIVAGPLETERLRARLSATAGAATPVVTIDGASEPDAIVEAVRDALRSSATVK